MSGIDESFLFVCLGNICRSPLAEAAMRAAAERACLKLHIDSAGTGGWHVGQPPDRRAQAVAMAHGIDISTLRARQVVEADFHRFDHIYALDRANLTALEVLRPKDGTARLALLLDALPGRKGEGVDDPYYGSDADFEETWRDVSAAADAIIEKLKRRA
jgi:protein-tyrosine phosphatase